MVLFQHGFSQAGMFYNLYLPGNVRALWERKKNREKDNIHIIIWQMATWQFWQFIIASIAAFITSGWTYPRCTYPYSSTSRPLACLSPSRWESALTPCVPWLQAWCRRGCVTISLIQPMCCMNSRQAAEVLGNLDSSRLVDCSQVSEVRNLCHRLFLWQNSLEFVSC